MATRPAPTARPTPKPAGQSAAAPLPQGARIPRPGLLLGIVRGLVIAALALTVARPFALPWAEAIAPVPALEQQEWDGPQSGWLTRALAFGTSDADGDAITPLIASVVWIILTTPTVVKLARLLAILGGCIAAVELALALWGRHRQSRTTPAIPITYDPGAYQAGAARRALPQETAGQMYQPRGPHVLDSRVPTARREVEDQPPGADAPLLEITDQRDNPLHGLTAAPAPESARRD
jgi:hypothetical protein